MKLTASCSALLGALLLAPAALAQTYLIDTAIPADAASSDWIGRSVDLSGERMIVGGWGHDLADVGNTGAAWIFERGPGGAWAETAKLLPGDSILSARYAWAVAIGDGVAFVGAYRDDTLANDAGAVYVYARQGDGSWVQTQKLIASDPTSGAEFGHALSLDGDRLAVGSPGGFFGSVRGVVYVFERQSDGTWTEATKVGVDDSLGNDEFGFDVGLSGDRIIAGAHLQDDNGGSSGAAYVFERQSDGTWPLDAKLLASDGASSDNFGYAVDIDGDLAVCGAWLDDDAGSGTGAGYVYERGPSGQWTEIGKLIGEDPGSGDHIGKAVAVDGSTVVIGALDDNVGSTSDRGTVHLYDVVASTPVFAGSFQSVGLSTGIFKDEEFGAAVAVDAGRIAVGAPVHDEVADDAGLAQILFSFAGSGQPAPAAIGVGTSGCDGPLSLGFNTPPRVDTAGFALTCENAPASGVGTLALGTASTPGLDLGLGFLLHVDPILSNPLLLFPMAADADGLGTTPLPLPDAPNLAGVSFTAQAIFAWTTCSLPPFGLSSSNGLSFTVLD